MIYRENQIQKEIVKAVRFLFRDAIIFSIPNEGKRNIRYATALKAAGMMHGVSDLICIYNGCVCFFEVKTPSGKLTEYQKQFRDAVTAQGFDYKVLTSAIQAIEFLNSKRGSKWSGKSKKQKTTVSTNYSELYQKFFNFMKQEHGLTLTVEEMDEIAYMVRGFVDYFNLQIKT